MTTPCTPEPSAPALGPFSVVREPILTRLEATIGVLEHIAEAHGDSQATRVTPGQAEWLRGYRAACKDITQALDTYRQAAQR